MATLLERGGTVELWGGWFVTLPPAHYERNGDSSWSVWGADWSVDVHIIEVGGHANDRAVSPQDVFGKERAVEVSGNGWVGRCDVLQETDSGRVVYRLAANLAATNTSMSFWVSYFEKHQLPFAEDLVRKVAHGV